MQAPLQTRNDSDAAQTDTARTVAQKRVLADQRPEAMAQRKLAEMMNNSPRVLQQRALNDAIHNSPRMVAQRHEMNALFGGAVKPQGDGAMPAEASLAQREEKTNKTGLPNQLKSGIESLSGMSMDHVKVHYNSDKPAQLQAHAYAQGSEIHLGAGQERHLPHEAWHVVQQAQGRVRPTLEMKGGVGVNDDAGLEHEADLMGPKALESGAVQMRRGESVETLGLTSSPGKTLQRVLNEEDIEDLLSVKSVDDLVEWLITAIAADDIPAAIERWLEENPRKSRSRKEIYERTSTPMPSDGSDQLLTRVIRQDQLGRRNIGTSSVRSSAGSLERNLKPLEATGRGKTIGSRIYTYMRKFGGAGIQGFHRKSDGVSRAGVVRGILIKMNDDPDRTTTSSRGKKFVIVVTHRDVIGNKRVYDLAQEDVKNEVLSGNRAPYGNMYKSHETEGVVAIDGNVDVNQVLASRAFRGVPSEGEMQGILDGVLEEAEQRLKSLLSETDGDSDSEENNSEEESSSDESSGNDLSKRAATKSVSGGI